MIFIPLLPALCPSGSTSGACYTFSLTGRASPAFCTRTCRQRSSLRRFLVGFCLWTAWRERGRRAAEGRLSRSSGRRGLAAAYVVPALLLQGMMQPISGAAIGPVQLLPVWRQRPRIHQIPGTCHCLDRRGPCPCSRGNGPPRGGRVRLRRGRVVAACVAFLVTPLVGACLGTTFIGFRPRAVSLACAHRVRRLPPACCWRSVLDAGTRWTRIVIASYGRGDAAHAPARPALAAAV